MAGDFFENMLSSEWRQPIDFELTYPFLVFTFYLVMPQFTYAGHYRCVLRYICKLIGIYRLLLPRCQVRTCEAVIFKGRFQSITAGVLFRICTHSSCGNCGMTE